MCYKLPPEEQLSYSWTGYCSPCGLRRGTDKPHTKLNSAVKRALFQVRFFNLGAFPSHVSAVLHTPGTMDNTKTTRPPFLKSTLQNIHFSRLYLNANRKGEQTKAPLFISLVHSQQNHRAICQILKLQIFLSK